MRKFFLLLCAFAGALLFSGCQSEGYKTIDGVIVFDTPGPRTGPEVGAGAQNGSDGDRSRGFIGLGHARSGAPWSASPIFTGSISKHSATFIPSGSTAHQAILARRGFPAAEAYSGEEGWKQLCERDDIDLVYIVTPWQKHVPMAVYAMEQGKHVAVEVPAATSLDECWQLVNTAEKTQRHCMMLENCVYDFFELTTLNMAKQGLFGDVLHVEGSYIHDLEAFWDYYEGNWRLDFNQKHRGDVYATHGLGPACQVLDIHRGDKMNYLVAVDTKSVNGLKQAEEKMAPRSSPTPTTPRR